MKLVTAEQMRHLEQHAQAAGISTTQLMENAGLAAAQEGWMLLGTLEDRIIVVLVGPGNNGGDGLVAARHLHDWGADVRVYLSRARNDDENLRQIEERGVPVESAETDADSSKLRDLLAASHLVIDALLGTGNARPIDGQVAAILDHLAVSRAKMPAPRLLAVDLPSGVNADTGAVDSRTPVADQTVTFGLPKIGLYTLPGSEFCGRIQTVDIGIPADAEADLPLSLLTSAWTREHLPRRPANANKGSFGRLLAVVGSVNYVGAAYLASASAYRAGAGLVTAALPGSIQPMVAPMVPEATFLPLSEEDGGINSQNVPSIQQALKSYDALLIGCGLGQRASTKQFVLELLGAADKENSTAVVVDADALNALAATDDWPSVFRGTAILTPHPGEFARLSGLSVSDVQADRVGVALRFAKQWQKIVVLKGANTVIASPDGIAMLSPFANPALATAGTGDVLAGAIGGLLAQGIPLFEAAVAAVYLHGAAGELLSRDYGDAGGLAGDLLRLLPEARRECLRVR